MDAIPKKILIVEDDELLIEQMQHALQEDGHEVSTAHDGEVGLAKALESKPDLVLLDIVIPKVNGLEFLQKLHESDWGKTVPVIVLTNMDNNTHLSQVLALGSYDYLVKTEWTLAALLSKVREKLGLPAQA